ncbi:hypothetical protein NUSPORA_00667 [Nucleospora cyclopteri]
MQNQKLSKETIFNDLPSEVKKKLVEIRNMGQNSFTFAMSHPLKDMGSVSIPSCKNLYNQFLEIIKHTEDLKDKQNISENYKTSVKNFKEFANEYKNNLNNKNIVDEFDKTYELMNLKYKDLIKKYNNN